MDDEHDEHYWYIMRCRAIYFSSVMATARLEGFRALREGNFNAYLYYNRVYVDCKATFDAIISEFP